MKIKIGLITLTLLLAMNAVASANLMGDSIGGSLTGLSSLNINTQFTSPATVQSGYEFLGHASNWFTGYGWMYWDIYVDVYESSFEVRIDDPFYAFGQDISHSSGILELRLSDLDYIGTPSFAINNVSLASFSRDYPDWWLPENTIGALTWGPDEIYLRFDGIADNDIYNFQIGFSGTDGPAPVPEPTTMILLSSGLIGLVGIGGRKHFKKKLAL